MTKIAAFLSTYDTAQNNVLSETLSAVREHLAMPIAYLSALDGEDVVYQEVSSAVGHTMIRKGDRRPARGSYCMGVLDGSLPQIIADTKAQQHELPLPVSIEGPIGAIISVPIYLPDGEIYGTFSCVSPDAMPSLNMRDHEVMTMFAGLAAEAVNHKLVIGREDNLIRQRIRDMITDRDFQTLLQPVFNLKTGTIAGAEALTRFRSTPYASPDLWYADAERVDMQQALELATITKAHEHLSKLPGNHYLALNCSAELLLTGVLATLLDGPEARRTVVELVDHTRLEDPTALQRRIRELRDLGIKVAIDDLGAEYQSLNTVMRLKPDLLKIDRGLVRGIHLDPVCQSLATSLVFFAKRINARVIAEGVESWDECAMLSELGVNYAQGYLLRKPCKLGEYLRLVQEEGHDIARDNGDVGVRHAS